MSFGFWHESHASSKYDWAFCVAAIVAFFVAFCTGATKSLNEANSSFVKSLRVLVRQALRVSLIACFFHVLAAVAFGKLIYVTYDEQLFAISPQIQAQTSDSNNNNHNNHNPSNNYDYNYNQSDVASNIDFDVDANSRKNEATIICAFASLVAFALCNLIAACFKLNFAVNVSQVSAILAARSVLANRNALTTPNAHFFVGAWLGFPALAAAIAFVTYLTIRRTVLDKSNVVKYALASVPYFCAFGVSAPFAIVLSCLPQALGARHASWLEVMFCCFVLATLVIVLTATRLVPRLRRSILDKLIEMRARNEINSREFAARSKCFVNQTFDSHDTLAKLGLSANLRSSRATLNSNDFASSQASDINKTSFVNVSATRQQMSRANPNYVAQLSSAAPSTNSPRASNPKLEHRQLIELADLRAASVSSSVAQHATSNNLRAHATRSDAMQLETRVDRLAVSIIFAPLQLLAGCLASLAHGSNDSLAIAVPLVEIMQVIGFYSLRTRQQVDDSSQQAAPSAQLSASALLLFVAANVGLCCGVAMYSRRRVGLTPSAAAVSQQMLAASDYSDSHDLATQLDSMHEFGIDLGASLATLLASRLGAPVCFAHCKLGAMLAVSCLVWRLRRSSASFGKMYSLETAASKSQRVERSRCRLARFRFALVLALNVALPALASTLVAFLVRALLSQRPHSELAH